MGVRVLVRFNGGTGINPHIWRQVEPGVWIAGNPNTASSFASEAQAIPSCIRNAQSPDEVFEYLGRVSGTFGLIISNERFLLASPGSFRNWPIYYRWLNDGSFVISDHPNQLISPSETPEINEIAESEFRHAGYCTGRDTLISGIQQVLPGEALILRMDRKKLETRRIFVYPAGSYYVSDEKGNLDLTQYLHNTYHRVLSDIIESAGDRTIVLPLTGGYDSRLLALLLAEKGRKDVHCVTYDLGGRSWEVSTASRVARHLGFRWSRIPLNGSLWRSWYYSHSFIEFQNWVSGWSSHPHRHEWPTAQFVRQTYGEGDNTLILSAICAGSIAGAFARNSVPDNEHGNRHRVAETIVNQFYHLNGRPADDKRRILVGRVQEVLNDLAGHISDNAELLPAWEWQERESKHIAGAMRVYEWHGIPWAAPFMDRRICEIWGKVAPSYRIGKKLHVEMVQAMMNGLPTANEPEYSRSNLRIVKRIGTNVSTFHPRELIALLFEIRQGPKHIAKLIHGEGWHVKVALDRLKKAMI